MFLLETLGLDALSMVVVRLDLADLISLWCCGNTRLNWALSEGKVVRRIEFRSSFKKPVCYFHLISHFHGLEHFLFYHRSAQGSLSVTLDQLALLPKELKILGLSVESNFSVVNDLLLASSSLFPHLHTLSLSSPSPLCLELNFPSTVTILNLGTSAAPIQSLSLDRLPCGLTELVCYARTLATPPDCKFPQTLETLDLHLKSQFQIAPLLPCRLRHLKYQSTFRLKPQISDWAELSNICLISLNLSVQGPFGGVQAALLPKTLEVLILDEIYGPNTDSWCLEILESMPQSITHLEGVWPSVISAALAQRIPRKVQFNYANRHIIMMPNAADWMPEETKFLNFGTKFWTGTSIDQITSLPPQLQYLWISAVSPSILKILPHHLKELKIMGGLHVLTGDEIKLISQKQLLSLTVETSSVTQCQPFDSLDSLQYLPATLRSLNATPIPETNWNDLKPVILPTPCHSAIWLPRSLRVLKIGFISKPSLQWFLNLPPVLEELEILSDSIHAHSLANLSTFSGLTSLVVTVLNAPEDGWAHNIKGLPTRLEVLKLIDLSGVPSRLTDPNIWDLPQSLLCVLLPRSPNITDQCRQKHSPDTIFVWGH